MVLTLSLLAPRFTNLCRQKRNRGINYGSNKVRFTNMVPVDRVRLRNTLKSAEPKAGGTLFTSEVKIEVKVRKCRHWWQIADPAFE